MLLLWLISLGFQSWLEEAGVELCLRLFDRISMSVSSSDMIFGVDGSAGVAAAVAIFGDVANCDSDDNLDGTVIVSMKSD